MELRRLEYFLMLSKELHFTKAAENLGISQPTLSHQIKALEQEIGQALFNRIGKKIELTKAGEIVQQEALMIQKSIDNIASKLEALTNVETGELKIAVLPGEMTDLVSTLCVKFNQLYPGVKLFVHTTDQVERYVIENQADFGIGFTFERNELLAMTKLYEEEFYFVSNRPHSERKVTFSSVLDQPLVLFPAEHQCRKLLDRTSVELGRKLDPIVETSSIDSILTLIRGGVGASVVSRTLYEFYDTADLYYQQIEKPELRRTAYLVMKKNGFINHATREFIQLLVQEIKRLRFQTEKEELTAL